MDSHYPNKSLSTNPTNLSNQHITSLINSQLMNINPNILNRLRPITRTRTRNGNGNGNGNQTTTTNSNSNRKKRKDTIISKIFYTVFAILSRKQEYRNLIIRADFEDYLNKLIRKKLNEKLRIIAKNE